jgi:hypothetical protein
LRSSTYTWACQICEILLSPKKWKVSLGSERRIKRGKMTYGTKSLGSIGRNMRYRYTMPRSRGSTHRCKRTNMVKRQSPSASFIVRKRATHIGFFLSDISDDFFRSYRLFSLCYYYVGRYIELLESIRSFVMSLSRMRSVVNERMIEDILEG